VAILIHGSAADHTTWSLLLASKACEGLSRWAYDRRGTGVTEPELDTAGPLTIERHADDVVELARVATEPVWLVGSSFGAIIALDVLRRYPEVARGAVLIEPPMAASDVKADPATVRGLLDRFDRTVEQHGGAAAAELFLRTVLGDAAFERVPRSLWKRPMQLWRQIRADSLALQQYRPRYAELAAVRAPVLLLGGAQSAPNFLPTLEALAAALPAARLEIVARAGHMLHLEANRRFAELLVEFVQSTSGAAD
jgi:pimeloyl-ACP methyl ester carboxylesterase